MRLALFLIISGLLVVLLGGCGPRWVNPDIPDIDQKAKLRSAKASCWELANKIAPAPRGDTLQPAEQPNPGIPNTLFQGNSAQYDAAEKREQVFNKCMKDKGWKLK